MGLMLCMAEFFPISSGIFFKYKKKGNLLVMNQSPFFYIFK